jgi:hypothetical protein
MVSLERARELLKDASLTDHEVKEARDVLRLLAEVIFDKWQTERRVREAKKPEDINKNRPDT